MHFSFPSAKLSRVKLSDLKKIDRSLPLCLIICEDQKEREEGVDAYLPKERTLIEPESFELFDQEVETLFMQRRAVLLSRVDKLKKKELERVLAYASSPNKSIALCMSAAQLSGKLVSAVDRSGVIYQLAKQKPWERQAHLGKELSSMAALRGVVFPIDIATEFVKDFGTDKTVLSSELDKLICYVSDRKEITRDDIRTISTPMSQQTVWELADAIFTRDFKAAYKVMHGLILAGVNIFPILSSLRTQKETAKRVLALAQQGGPALVQTEFPYLKGRLYERKVALYKRYGRQGLDTLSQVLFQTELEARNSQHEPTFILEKLLVQTI